MSGYRYIHGIDHYILDAMVETGFALKDDEGYILSEAGEEFLREWIFEQLGKFGCDIQLPLEGMDGPWIVAVDSEELGRFDP